MGQSLPDILDSYKIGRISSPGYALVDNGTILILPPVDLSGNVFCDFEH